MATTKVRLLVLVAPFLIGPASWIGCGGDSSTGGTPDPGDGDGGSTGSGGTRGAGGRGGSQGSGGTPGAGGSGGEASGGASAGGSGGEASGGSAAGGSSSDASPGSGGSSSDASPGGSDMAAARPARVLLYTRHTTQTHAASYPVAIASLTELFKAASIEVEASEDLAMFTAANLARFGAVVMVNANGIPVGMPGTTEGNALAAFVRAGGGLAAFHATGNTTYGAGHPFIALLGAAFQNTGGGVRNVSCAPEGQHPSVAKVPTPLASPGDETYAFGPVEAMNQIVLRCDPAMGNQKQPGSWLRDEGMGRVFYTTLGHGPMAWAKASAFLTTHAWPSILWVLGR